MNRKNTNSILLCSFHSYHADFPYFEVDACWIYNIEYPTNDEDSCLKLEVEVGNGKRYTAKFHENCKSLYNTFLRWVTSYRLAFRELADSEFSRNDGGLQVNNA